MKMRGLLLGLHFTPLLPAEPLRHALGTGFPPCREACSCLNVRVLSSTLFSFSCSMLNCCVSSFTRCLWPACSAPHTGLQSATEPNTCQPKAGQAGQQ